MVSVVIPTFNGAAFLTAGLQSVIDQTHRPAEIVVVDDGSTDGTPDLVKAFAQDAPVPIRFIRAPGNSGGPSRPYNIGIEESKYDQIVLLDQDDLMKPRRIESQLKALVECPQCSIVIGHFSIIGGKDDDMMPMWPVPQLEGLTDHVNGKAPYSVIASEPAFKVLLSRNYAGSMSNFCFSRQWFRRIGKFDETVTTCADLDFMLRAVTAGPISVVNEKVFEYRWLNHSLQHKDVTKSLLEATMVRLRAASEKPDWAGDELNELRRSALILAQASVRKGDLRAVRTLGEMFSKHKAFQTMKERINNKTRRLMGLSPPETGD